MKTAAERRARGEYTTPDRSYTQTQDYRQKMSDTIIAVFKDNPEIGKKISENNIKSWAGNEERKLKLAETNRIKNQSPEFRAKLTLNNKIKREKIYEEIRMTGVSIMDANFESIVLDITKVSSFKCWRNKHLKRYTEYIHQIINVR